MSATHIPSLKNQSLVELAPSGVSAWSGPHISMTRGVGDALRVKVRVPCCSIAHQASSVASTQLGGNYTALYMQTRSSYGSGANPRFVECVQLGPANIPSLTSVATPAPLWTELVSNIDCSLVALLAAAFSKYRMVGDLILSYQPQTTTIDPANFSLVFSDDPEHPQIGTGAYTVGTGTQYPNFAVAKNSVNSVVFASWSTWARTFKLDNDTVYYTTTPFPRLNSPQTPTTYPPFYFSEPRLSQFGVLQCYSTEKNGVDSVQVKGELYYEAEFEFFDYVPVSGNAPIPFSLASFIELAQEKMEANKLDSLLVRKNWSAKQSLNAHLPVHVRRYYSLVPRREPLGPDEKEVDDVRDPGWVKRLKIGHDENSWSLEDEKSLTDRLLLSYRPGARNRASTERSGYVRTIFGRPSIARPKPIAIPKKVTAAPKPRAGPQSAGIRKRKA